MIKIEIIEDLKDRKGKAIGHSCSFEMSGNGDLIASEVKCILDTFDEKLPAPVWMAALDSFLNDKMCGNDCEGCDHDCE